ncbi:hypothetical protein SARC_05545 [Sphaeroforma arctica JP610]|uniref:Phosphatidic acid phosphatase type 2/haloperoxidase domain-containing protein n=1 Tax=Sphaeroforma arctica JP610 TaxID=667725 RepID=A0A0L0FZZ2_9EUKA|nr:hypothetical protein SARC_05545 [Sphaeroforma arctica JP610]KNC82164.1 hypothetical protein SARC_05545 [Sphaeroforma arctica JP610]|eukprot:XP_014156066.1 hypothetical protein SARC_05545 [Sphaeroforma arctica JP610]
MCTCIRDLIKTLQTHYPLSGVPLFSMVGSGLVTLLMNIYARWMMPGDIGWRLSFVASEMLCVNGLAKAYLKGPRPYWMDDKIKTLDPTLETSYGFPSGHVMGLYVVWGILAWHVGGVFTFTLWAVMTILVAYSRVYTGAHFLHDVVGGCILGTVLLATDILNEHYVLKSGQRGSFIEATILITWALVAFTGVIKLAADINGRVKLAMVYEGVSGAGFSLGLAVSHLLEAFNPLDCVENPPMPLHLCLVGLITVVALDKAGKQLTEYEDGTRDMTSLALQALVYAALMVWSTYLWPRLVFQCSV